MPNLKVPVRACKFKVETTPFIRQELEKRVRATSHIPDTDHRKYRMDTIKSYNQSVRRIKEGGQLTLTQVLKNHHSRDQTHSQPKKRGEKDNNQTDDEVASPNARKNTPSATKKATETQILIWSSQESSDDPDFLPKPSRKGSLSQKWNANETQSQFSQTQTTTAIENKHPNTTGTQSGTTTSKKHRGNPKTHDKMTNQRSTEAPPLYPSAAKCGRMNVNTPPPAVNDKEPQPGDLVMASAGDIHHPAAEYLAVHRTYIIFGVVRSYTYIKWSSKSGREEWNNYTNNFKRLDVVWEPVVSTLHSQRYIDETMETKEKPGEQDDWVDLPTTIPPVHHSKIKVVCKKNNCNIDGLNPYFQEWIGKHFKFNIHTGWKFKQTDQGKTDTNDQKKPGNDYNEN
jgi:hypothetical protein